MAQTITINSPVEVTAMGFGRGMRAYPRRIEFGGTSYNFIDAGLRMLVGKGRTQAEILTMSDGSREYHLRSDNHGGSWTLLAIS